MIKRPNLQWRERLDSPLTWHYAGLIVMLIVVIGLATRLGFDWVATNSRSSETMANKQVELKALNLETAPLRGLDQQVVDSRSKMKAFYSDRIPASYSAIATRIGELQVKSGVRLSRVQYTQGTSGTDLTEISMDAGISGDYPSIMRFVNSVERDRFFFVIRAMSLTGQQGGLVNLRMRVSTWLRPADAMASGLPQTSNASESNSVISAGKGGN